MNEIKKQVFIHTTINDIKREEIIQILKAFQPEGYHLNFTKRSARNDDLRIISSIAMNNIKNPICLTITDNCLKQMKKLDINPFTDELPSLILRNLHLNQMKLALLQLNDSDHERISTYIARMGGSIIDNIDEADFVIIGSENDVVLFDEIDNMIYMRWIEKLYESSSFIEPKKYYVSENNGTKSEFREYSFDFVDKIQAEIEYSDDVPSPIRKIKTGKRSTRDFESSTDSDDDVIIIDPKVSINIDIEKNKTRQIIEFKPKIDVPAQKEDDDFNILVEQLFNTKNSPSTKPAVIDRPVLPPDELNVFSQLTLNHEDNPNVYNVEFLPSQTETVSTKDKDHETLLDFLH